MKTQPLSLEEKSTRQSLSSHIANLIQFLICIITLACSVAFVSVSWLALVFVQIFVLTHSF